MVEKEKEVSEEMDTEEYTEGVIFQALIGKLIYQQHPEDYWEKEGIGWK